MKKFLKTLDAADYLSVDVSFLKKNMGVIFFEGIHYFRPANVRILRWEIMALDNWMYGGTRSLENDLLVEKLLA